VIFKPGGMPSRHANSCTWLIMDGVTGMEVTLCLVMT